jgi:hypothetical protein
MTHAQTRWAITVAAGAVALGLPLGAQGGFFGFSEDIELVEQFDKNGDKRLDTAERRAARPVARSQGGGGGGFGRPGRRGAAIGSAQPGPRLTPSQVRNYPDAPLYDLATLRTIFLQFESSDWEQELGDFYGTDVEVPATMTVDGRTYKDVGVHFRGASSFRFVPQGYKRSLNLSLDFVHDAQRLGGYRTLNLLNANNDATFLRAVLYTEIARQYIPTPRMNYVRVVINGESWGIYLNAQQFNSDFTREHFGATGGARWKTPGRPGGRSGLEYLGDDASAYRLLYEIKTKDEPKSWAELVRLTRVLNQTPAANLEAALKPILNVDGVLRFLAIEVALANSDGYWTRASDYNLFMDAKGLFHLIPHDVNEALGGEGGGGFGGRGEPDPLVALNDPSKPLRSKLLAVPALQARYLGYLRDIAQRHMNWTTIAPRARQHQALIAADVKADTRKLYSTEAFEADVASIEAFFNRRRATLLR